MRIPIRNTGSEPLLLHVEPWGELFRIPPGKKIDLRCDPARNEEVVIDGRPGLITVWLVQFEYVDESSAYELAIYEWPEEPL